jgi:hypothetical protein
VHVQQTHISNFTWTVNKNAINTKKVYPPPKIFTTPIYPPSRNLEKPHGPSLRIFKLCASIQLNMYLYPHQVCIFLLILISFLATVSPFFLWVGFSMYLPFCHPFNIHRIKGVCRQTKSLFLCFIPSLKLVRLEGL